MATVAVVAHKLRLNKAIALLASNISIPPIAVIILGVGLIIGHWMFTGEVMTFPPPTPSADMAIHYILQTMAGSVVLGFLVAVPGTLATYAVARLAKRK